MVSTWLAVAVTFADLAPRRRTWTASQMRHDDRTLFNGHPALRRSDYARVLVPPWAVGEARRLAGDVGALDPRSAPSTSYAGVQVVGPSRYLCRSVRKNLPVRRVASGANRLRFRPCRGTVQLGIRAKKCLQAGLCHWAAFRGAGYRHYRRGARCSPMGRITGRANRRPAGRQTYSPACGRG